MHHIDVKAGVFSIVSNSFLAFGYIACHIISLRRYEVRNFNMDISFIRKNSELKKALKFHIFVGTSKSFPQKLYLI